MRFGETKEAEIFRALAAKSVLQVGMDYGFDKVYKDTRAIRNAVNAISMKVRHNPEQYGVKPEEVALVQKSLDERKLAVVPKEASLAEKNDIKNDIKELVQGIRDKTFLLINKKLDRVKNSTKKLDAISFKDLGIIAGIAFDKTQILRGEATETVTVISKIDQSLPPGEIIKLALQMREQSVDQNTGR